MKPQQTTIDGIDTLWAPAPGPLQATLMFRVGASDESFPTVGITHLLEHLIYSRMPVLHHEHNGSVGLFSTRFTLEGNETEVLEALAGICRAITEMAEGRVGAAEIAKEAGVLSAEGSGVVPPSVAEMIDACFGPVGPGLAAVDETYLARITPHMVGAWAAKYFTRENAVLVLSGPPPAGLRLDVPSGQRQERIEPTMLEGAGRSEYPSRWDEVVISFSVPPQGHALEHVNGILARTLRDRVLAGLRRSEGLLYDIGYSEITHGTRNSLVILQIDVAPKHAVEVARRLLGMIRELRDAGITSAELQRVLKAGEEAAADEREGFEEAVEAGTARLLGTPWLGMSRRLEAHRSFTNQELAVFLKDFESSVVVGIPMAAYVRDPETEEPEAKLMAFREHRPAIGITGKAYRRGPRGLLLKVPRDAQLIVGEAGFDFHAEGDSRAYRFDDVVAGMWSTDRHQVYIVGRDGFITELTAEWFRKGGEALDELQRRLRANDPSKIVPDADEYQLEEEAAS